MFSQSLQLMVRIYEACHLSKDKQTIDNCDEVVEWAVFIDRGSGKKTANCLPKQRERVVVRLLNFFK